MEKFEFMAINASSEQELVLLINPYGREGWSMSAYSCIPAKETAVWQHIAILQRPIISLDSLDLLVAASAASTETNN